MGVLHVMNGTGHGDFFWGGMNLARNPAATDEDQAAAEAAAKTAFEDVRARGGTVHRVTRGATPEQTTMAPVDSWEEAVEADELNALVPMSGG